MVSDWPDLADHLPLLQPMLRHASRAIRLANDLRTFAKEETENNRNAVNVMKHLYESSDSQLGPGEALRGAHAFVRDKLRDETSAVKRFPQVTPLHANLARLTEVTLALYQVGDFHTLDSDALLSLERPAP